MKLTKKRVKEILKVLGLEAAKPAESIVDDVYYFDLGIIGISITDRGENGKVRADIRLLDSACSDKSYYFPKESGGMFWTEESEYESVYDEDGSHIDVKEIDCTYSFYREDNRKYVGVYWKKNNSLSIHDGWIPGQFFAENNFRDLSVLREFAAVRKHADSKSYQFEELGKYYSIKDKIEL